ncbi:hypothetical protein [Metabacillus bambusae]|uniref:HNH endonuclease n=1 Tax=Metabacillus bambusae TaxID=2795218 RepID=A0ABS3MZU8_9BACI|nr:hypothetical protein [Metabacillus bambusae]MBO1511552.1 hypothetical protein [Metabacillus bambusae]
MMLQIQETKRTRQISLVNKVGEVVQKVCRTCQHVKLIEDFPKYTQGYTRADCESCHRDAQRAYIRANKDKRTTYKQNERARVLGLPDTFSEGDYKRLKEVAESRCMISGEVANLQCDHVQALSKGWLGSTAGNIILVSEKVNQAKRDMSLFEFIKSERSNGLINEEQLYKTLRFLAQVNEMSLTQYINFLKDSEEIAIQNKKYWEVE